MTPGKCPKCGADSWDVYNGRVDFECGASWDIAHGKYHGTIDEFDPCEINTLQRQRGQLAATLESQRRGAANAERMLCEALGVESGADVLDAIAALRERVKRLEEVGDYWIPRDSDAQEAWANAKGAKL